MNSFDNLLHYPPDNYHSSDECLLQGTGNLILSEKKSPQPHFTEDSVT